MDDKNLAIVLTIALLVSATLLSRVFAKIAQRLEGKTKEVVPPGATRLAEMLVETRDISWRGFVTDNQFGGKLVLSSAALVYCRPNETKIALALDHADVLAVAVGEKGWISKSKTLVLTYVLGPKKKRKKATFIVHAGSHKPEEFAALVADWQRTGTR
jgi:hypothetical protein